MICVNPNLLIDKYKEYVRRNPRINDRRIILDAFMIDQFKDMIFFEETHLL